MTFPGSRRHSPEPGGLPARRVPRPAGGGEPHPFPAPKTVLERVHVRSIDPSALARFHDNDPGLAATMLRDPGLQRRNGVTLDWGGAWTLRKEPAGVADAEVIDASVRFVQWIPIRLTTLLSVGLDVSRSEVRRLVADGTLSSAHRLTGRSYGDFSFTLRREAMNKHCR